jgi:hypothetical protein
VSDRELTKSFKVYQHSQILNKNVIEAVGSDFLDCHWKLFALAFIVGLAAIVKMKDHHDSMLLLIYLTNDLLYVALNLGAIKRAYFLSDNSGTLLRDMRKELRAKYDIAKSVALPPISIRLSLMGKLDNLAYFFVTSYSITACLNLIIIM